MSDNQAETALPGVVVTGEAKEALELDELKVLCAELCDLYDKWAVGNESGYGLDAREAARCMDLADGIGHHVPALVAEVERLRAQRDETSALHAPMRVHTGSKTHGGPPEYGFICAVCRSSHPCRTRRVLSRTEDGTNG